MERVFENAGREMVGSRGVIVGDAGDVSILAYDEESAVNAEDPVLELSDRARNVACWVRVILSYPGSAADRPGSRGEFPPTVEPEQLTGELASWLYSSRI